MTPVTVIARLGYTVNRSAACFRLFRLSTLITDSRSAGTRLATYAYVLY